MEMQMKKRNCEIDFNVSFAAQRWQHFEFTINGDKHEFTCSAAVSEMLGDFIDVLYELYIESNDEARATKVEYMHDNPDSNTINGIAADFTWDNEGDVLNWKISRRLYEPEIMLDIQLNYDSFDFGEKSYQYRIPYFDLCYAVAKATTALLKQTGIIGYHFLGEWDSIDIHHFLYVKHLGIFRKPIPYSPFPHEEFDPYTASDKKTSFLDEMKLLAFEM